MSPHWPGSVPEALAEVDEALEATEAFWAARRMVSSRVRRLTWEIQS
jgi:hypothetical protein